MIDWERKRSEVTEVAKRAGFGETDARLLAHFARPAGRLELDRSRRPGNGQSKLGGLPDLPESFDWPVGIHGDMVFIAQIAAGETACLEGVDGWRAADDLLLFFADGDPVTGATEAGAVLAVPRDTALSKPARSRRGPGSLPESALRVRPVMTPPMSFEHIDQELKYDLDADDWKAWEQLYEGLGCGPASIAAGHHQLLGNPWTVGSLDPVWMGAVQLATDAEEPDDAGHPFRLLAQFTTDQDADVEFADAGTLYFTTRATDIATADYRRVAVYVESN